MMQQARTQKDIYAVSPFKKAEGLSPKHMNRGYRCGPGSISFVRPVKLVEPSS